MKSMLRWKARRNPTMTPWLIGGAVLAAAVVGIVWYEKRAAAALPPSNVPPGNVPPVQLNLTAINALQPQTARVGDTVVVTLPVFNAANVLTFYTDTSTGTALKLVGPPNGIQSNVGGTAHVTFTYNVVAAGSETINIALSVNGLPGVALKFPITVS